MVHSLVLCQSKWVDINKLNIHAGWAVLEFSLLYAFQSFVSTAPYKLFEFRLNGNFPSQ